MLLQLPRLCASRLVREKGRRTKEKGGFLLWRTRPVHRQPGIEQRKTPPCLTSLTSPHARFARACERASGFWWALQCGWRNVAACPPRVTSLTALCAVGRSRVFGLLQTLAASSSRELLTRSSTTTPHHQRTRFFPPLSLPHAPTHLRPFRQSYTMARYEPPNLAQPTTTDMTSDLTCIKSRVDSFSQPDTKVCWATTRVH